MPFEKLGDKLIYKFEPFLGWTPSAQAVFSGKGLYDIENLIIEGNILKTRGGFEEVNTATAIDFIKNVPSAASNTLVGTSGGNVCTYNFGDNIWATGLHHGTALLRSGGETCIAAIPKSSGETDAVITNGSDENIRWPLSGHPLELGSIPVADTYQSWIEDSGTGSFTYDDTSGNWLSGGKSLKITVASGNTYAVKYSLGASEQTVGGADSQTPHWRLGYLTDGENGSRQVASKFTAVSNLEVNTVEVKYRCDFHSTAPDTMFYFVRIETDAGGLPSGTLVSANAYGDYDIVTNNKDTDDTTYTIQISLAAEISLTLNTTYWVVHGIAESTSVDGTYDWYDGSDAASVENALRPYFTDSSEKVGKERRDNTTPYDPQTSSWDYSSLRHTYCRLYSTTPSGSSQDYSAYIDTGTAADNDYLKFEMKVDDKTHFSTTSHIGFTDADTDTLLETLEDPSTNDTWQTYKLDLSAFTDGATFDATDVVFVNISIVNDGDGELNVYFDNIRIEKSRIDGSQGSKDRPPIAKYCVESPHGDRVLLANTIQGLDNSGPNYLYYSDTYDISSFPSTNFVSFPEPINGLAKHGGFVYVFGYTRAWVMEPNYGAADLVATALDWKISEIDGPGTIANRSISPVSFGETAGLMYVSYDGVYLCRGTQAIKLSNDIDDIFSDLHSTSEQWYADSISKTYQNSCSACTYDGKYHLFYTTRTSDESVTTNKQVLIFDGKKWTKFVLASDDIKVPAVMVVDGSNTLVGVDNSGDTLKYSRSRNVVLDGASTAFESFIQTGYMGLELFKNISWETLNIWVRPYTTDASSLKVQVYRLLDYDNTDITTYDEWEEDLSGGDTINPVTITKAFTPNNAYRWHRLKIPLRDTSTPQYPTARAISLKIYDDNDKPLDYMFESIICTPLSGELN